MSVTNRRVPGHALQAEGAPHDPDGKRLTGIFGSGTGGPGYALCECGAMSELRLNTAAARYRWHRRHKFDAVVANNAQEDR